MRIPRLVIIIVPAFLTGCSALNSTAPSTPMPGVALQGRVHGGQQPVAGANIYLFAANTTGYGQPSISLLKNVAGTTLDTSGGPTSGDYYVTTDVNGSFTITGDYTCTTGQQVYLYALGGNPGAGANSAAGLMAVLGSCPGTGNFLVATPFIMVNEVSTIAAAYAFAGYATDATHVSSSGTALAQIGIGNAFASSNNLEVLSTGVALATTPAGTATVPQSTINSLANILAACINSTGPGSSTCSTLFSNMLSAGTSGTTATDTATAAIYLAHNPGVNVATLFAIPNPSAPFSPVLSAQPNDFTLGLKFVGGGIASPEGLAIDGSGNAWITNFTPSSVTEISPSGAFLSGTNGYTGGGENGCWGIAIDLNGNAWVTNQNGNSVTEISSTGTFVSGASGYTGGGITGPRPIAIDGGGNAWIGNYIDPTGSTITVLSSAGAVLSGSGYTGTGNDYIYFPLSIAIGADESAWIVNYNNSNITRLALSGTDIAGSNGYSGGGIHAPNGIAIDSSGNAWVSNPGTGNGSVSEFSSSGTALSGSNGYTNGDLFEPDAIAIDGGGNVWVGNYDGNRLTELSNSDVVLSGPTGYNAGSYTGGGIYRPAAIAVDGSGNVWIANTLEVSVTELIGAATPLVTPLSASVKNNTIATRP